MGVSVSMLLTRLKAKPATLIASGIGSYKAQSGEDQLEQEGGGDDGNRGIDLAKAPGECLQHHILPVAIE